MSRGSYPEYGTAGGGGSGFGLFQSFVSTGDPTASNTEPATTLKFSAPAKSGAGNCLQLTITYPDGNAPTAISDTVNGSWSATPIVTASSAGANDTSVYLFPNCSAGSVIVTITFASGQQPVPFVFREWYGIATSSPAVGHSSAANQVYNGTNAIACGSFTPTANSIVVSDFHINAASASGNPTSFTAGTGFTLLDADIGWVNDQGLPKAGQYIVTSAAVNPSIKPNGDTADGFNCVAVALKIASGSGTAPPATGIMVAKFIEQFTGAFSSSTWVLQFPSVGNLRVFGTTAPTNQTNITSVTDSDGNTWTSETQSNGLCQLYYFAGATPNPNLTVTLHCSGASGAQMHGAFWDVINAAASPLGAVAQGSQSNVGNLSSVSNEPSITPDFSSSLMIAMLSNGLGPTIVPTSPSGAYSGIVQVNPPSFTGWVDNSNYSSGDGWAHLYNTSTSAQSWTWTITNQGAAGNNSVGSLAVEFKST